MAQPQRQSFTVEFQKVVVIDDATTTVSSKLTQLLGTEGYQCLVGKGDFSPMLIQAFQKRQPLPCCIIVNAEDKTLDEAQLKIYRGYARVGGIFINCSSWDQDAFRLAFPELTWTKAATDAEKIEGRCTSLAKEVLPDLSSRYHHYATEMHWMRNVPDEEQLVKSTLDSGKTGLCGAAIHMLGHGCLINITDTKMHPGSVGLVLEFVKEWYAHRAPKPKMEETTFEQDQRERKREQLLKEKEEESNIVSLDPTDADADISGRDRMIASIHMNQMLGAGANASRREVHFKNSPEVNKKRGFTVAAIMIGFFAALMLIFSLAIASADDNAPPVRRKHRGRGNWEEEEEP